METIEIIRVKFLWPGKMFEFVNAHNLPLKSKDKVVVETYNGGSMVGTITVSPRIRERRKEDGQLTTVLRIATDQDLALDGISDDARTELKRFFETRLRARQMTGVRLIDCEKADGGRRLIIYFSSEQRRFDAKDMAVEVGQRFGVRVEMRMVGIRDAARLAGGIGKCGLSMCCSTWLPEAGQVTIRMAKDQGLSLDPEGISGQCGRLLCCLGYEQENYVEMGLGLPKVGKVVVTALGDARVTKLDVLKGLVTVRTETGAYETFPAHEVKRKFGPGGAKEERNEAEDSHKDQDSDSREDL